MLTSIFDRDQGCVFSNNFIRISGGFFLVLLLVCVGFLFFF